MYSRRLFLLTRGERLPPERIPDKCLTVAPKRARGDDSRYAMLNRHNENNQEPGDLNQTYNYRPELTEIRLHTA